MGYPPPWLGPTSACPPSRFPPPTPRTTHALRSQPSTRSCHAGGDCAALRAPSVRLGDEPIARSGECDKVSGNRAGGLALELAQQTAAPCAGGATASRRGWKS